VEKKTTAPLSTPITEAEKKIPFEKVPLFQEQSDSLKIRKNLISLLSTIQLDLPKPFQRKSNICNWRFWESLFANRSTEQRI